MKKKGTRIWKRKVQTYEKESYKDMKKKGTNIRKRKVQGYEKR